MLKRAVLIILILYFFSVLSTSFLIHWNFSFLGIWFGAPDFVLIILFLLLFFDIRISKDFFFEALLAGLFLDLFSSRFLGISSIILFLAAIVLEEISRVVKKQNIFFFIVFFLFLYLFYYLSLGLITQLISKRKFFLEPLFLPRALYNLIFLLFFSALCHFCQVKKLLKKEK